MTAFRALVVVPTYNNAPTIASVVRGCLGNHDDVLVVDDGSTDGSGDLARAAGATVISIPVNRGKGAAMKTAFSWALEHGYSHAVTLDGDAQHDPDQIYRFLEAAEACPVGIVVGVRDMLDSPPRSRFARWISNLFMRLASGQFVGDSQTGYRAYPLGTVLGLQTLGERYEFEVEILAKAGWKGLPILQVPCTVWYAPPEERQSHFRLGADLAIMIGMYRRLLCVRVKTPSLWWLRSATTPNGVRP